MGIKLLALGLAAQLVLPQGIEPAELERRSRIIEKALSIPLGAAIEVRTSSKEILTGKLHQVGEETIILLSAAKTSVTQRAIAYADIRSLKQTNQRMHPAAASLLTLTALYAVGLIVGVAVQH